MKTSTSRILIAVRSRLAHPSKREMLRPTWAANVPEGMTVRFLVGGKCDRPEPDIMTVEVPDTIHDLPAKVPVFLDASPVETALQVRHPEWEAEVDYHSKSMCGKRPGYEFGWGASLTGSSSCNGSTPKSTLSEQPGRNHHNANQHLK